MSQVSNINSNLVHKDPSQPIKGYNNTTLDQNSFLKLLTVQLSKQDPLNPVEDKEFIAQMAQFSSLEQLQVMNDKLDFLGDMSKSIDNQNKAMSEIYNSIESIQEIIKEFKVSQSDSLDNDTKMINQLINLNTAIKGYDMGSGE